MYSTAFWWLIVVYWFFWLYCVTTVTLSLACSRRSDSGDFSSLSLLRTALHYLNAWNRLLQVVTSKQLTLCS